MPTAIHDIFRFIKLYSPDGTTLEHTLEADSVSDTLSIRRGDGVSWNLATVSPSTTIAVTVSTHTGNNQIQGAYYLDGVERNSIALVKGREYIFDQSDSSNASFGGYLHPLTFSNTVDGSVSGAISGVEYEDGITYLIDDAPVSKANLMYPKTWINWSTICFFIIRCAFVNIVYFIIITKKIKT